MALIAKRFFVAGRVQGVCFRAYTRARAQELSLTGYAKNLSDGRVEILAVGDTDAVEKLAQWLWQGSPAAAVTQVQCDTLSPTQLSVIPTHFTTQ